MHIDPEDVDEIIENGELVFSHFWDSGGPGAGAETETIYRFQGLYYPLLSYSEGLTSYDSLADALKDSELNVVNEASEELIFPPHLAGEILPLLQYIGEDEKVILINGDNWHASPSAGLRRLE